MLLTSSHSTQFPSQEQGWDYSLSQPGLVTLGPHLMSHLSRASEVVTQVPEVGENYFPRELERKSGSVDEVDPLLFKSTPPQVSSFLSTDSMLTSELGLP